MNLKNKRAFTLAEMMIVLLVISLIMAAFLPIMTKRSKSKAASGGSSNSIWQYVGAGSSPADIYSNEGGTLGAIIGTDKFGSGESAKLLLNTSGIGQPHILFKQTVSGSPAKTGILTVDSKGNVGLGDVSFDATTPTKNYQLALGSGAQTKNDYGIAIGYGAASTQLGDIVIGEKNLGGADLSNNIYIGYQNPSGYLIGYAGASNVAIGPNALAHEILNPADQGSGNIAIGVAAAKGNTTGGSNIALGYRALTYNSVGQGNIGLGSNACGNVTGSNKVCIAGDGPDGSSIANRSWAAYQTDNVNRIFIGSPPPSGGAGIPGMIEIHRGASYYDATASTVINSNLYVYGKIYDSDNAIHALSDRRLKNISGVSTDGLAKIRQLKVYNYTLKRGPVKTPQVGVMAQDLQKIFPNAVEKNNSGFLTTRQNDVVYAMVNAIKELDGTVQGLANTFKHIATRIQTLDDKIMALIKVDQINSKKIKELQLKNNLLEQQNKTFEERLQKLEKRRR